MATPISICNQALSLVGGNALTSFTDGTTEANLCNTLWQTAFESVLSEVNWPCAIRRATLAKLLYTPQFGYSGAFQLPSDCLRVLSLDNDALDWRREGRTVLVDAAAVSIRYLSNAVEMALLDAPLVSVLAARMAAELAPAIAQSNTLTINMWKLYESKLDNARRIMGLEGSVEAFREGLLVEVR